MVLDTHTLMMLAAALTLLVGLSLRYVLHEYPATLYPSISRWTFGILTQATAWILYSLRDQVPDWLSIVIGNTLLSWAFAEQVRAVRLFSGLRCNRALIYLPVLAVLLVEIVFTYFVPSMRLRLLTATPLFCVQMLYGGGSLIGTQQVRRRSRRLTAAAFFALAAVLGARVVYQGIVVEVLANAFWTSPMQTMVFAFASIFPVLATLGFVLMCSDRLHTELERQAMIDPLTGVNNRRTLNALAAQALTLAQRHGRPLALLLIDADHFKQINDGYGHSVGDQALQLLTATLRRTLRNEDLFGRLGGEEFVAVLPESDIAAALVSAERARQAVEASALQLPDGGVLPLRVSIGVAGLQPGDDFASLLRRADAAMYVAKEAGRNCVRAAADATPAPLDSAVTS